VQTNADSDPQLIGKNATCCIEKSDCLSSKCDYGKCTSNCPEADYLLQNRGIGQCCDYNIHCRDGLTCFAGTKTCGDVNLTGDDDDGQILNEGDGNESATNEG